MKKTILSIAVIAAAVFTASCQKENLQENTASEGSASVFTATIETGANTKTTVERVTSPSVVYKTYWEDTDKISINGVSYTATPDGTDATKATFAKDPDTQTDPTAPFHAYFPASMYSDSKATLPASYTYADGKYNMPMYAESSSLDLSFRNLCGVLAITVNGSDFTSVEKIEVSSDKQMNGEFTATADGVLTFASKTLTAADKKVTLNFTSAKAIASDGLATFYIPVPANTHRPLTIKISDGTNSETMVTNKSGGVEVERNTVYPITFAPIKTIADVLATVEGGFPEDKSGGKAPVVPSNAWSRGSSGWVYKYSSALIISTQFVDGNYCFGSLTTQVTKGENCYTASISYGNLEFNMTNGILTSIKFIHDPTKPNGADYDGTYTVSTFPAGATKGVFSVSETKTVHFSQGNLWCVASKGKWYFEENQYSISSSWDANHVSNFYWSKTESVAYAESYEESGTSASDVFFTNATGFTVGGQTNVWKTLSHDEWKYLFEHHTYKYVPVNNKSGIVIAPDGFSGTIADSYSITDWATAESNGLVFLPNTGYRPGPYINETEKSCIYWTSTASGVNEDGNPTAYRMFFQWNGSTLIHDFVNDGERQWAVGIRLVTE